MMRPNMGPTYVPRLDSGERRLSPMDSQSGLPWSIYYEGAQLEGDIFTSGE